MQSIAAFDAEFIEKSGGPASYKLRVLSVEKLFPNAPPALTVYVNTDEPGLGSFPSSACLLQRNGGSDCVMRVRAHARVPCGSIAMSEAQRINLRMAEHEVYSFEPFDWRPWRRENGFQFLTEVVVEVRLMPRPAAISSTPDGHATTSSGVLAPGSGDLRGIATSGGATAWDDVHIPLTLIQAAVRDLTAGHVLSAKQRLSLQVDGHPLLLRVLEVHNLDEAEREALVVYHCYRGVVGPHTRVTVEEWDADASGFGTPGQPPQQQGSDAAPAVEEAEGSSRRRRRGTARLVVDGAETGGRRRAAKPLPNIVNVTTSDEEWFPVKKALLRPCIALTKYVQDNSAEAPSVTIDVDCLIFDRVLLFLEHLAEGRAHEYDFDINLTEDMMRAAQVLGLGALTDHCRQKQGEFDSRIREYTFEEVVASNRAGNVWLIIDGAIFDVTRWLPEHPGGSTIIPRQALNIDCARFFELYHSSRESFMYLKEFYLGEIRAEDRPTVPMQAQPPSSDFLEQLREHTGFRLNISTPQFW
eukprot:jgi/Mesvir1/8829/Mv02730-RA.1